MRLTRDVPIFVGKNLVTYYSTLYFQDISNYTQYALLRCTRACENIGFAEINVIDTNTLIYKSNYKF